MFAKYKIFLFQVNQLLISVAAALRKAQNNGTHPSNKSSGFFTKMCSFLDFSFDGTEDNSPADIKKTATYLEASINYLCAFFKEVGLSLCIFYYFPTTEMWSACTCMGGTNQFEIYLFFFFQPH